MRSVEFAPFILTETADIYSIRIDGNIDSELNKFLITFKDTRNEYLKRDFWEIISTIKKMSNDGIKEIHFRPEGKLNDRVCALPIYTIARNSTQGTLRLYCIRISDKLLILGGGGVKKTRTYEEDEELLEKVKTLQNIDKVLLALENDGVDLYSAMINLKISIQ